MYTKSCERLTLSSIEYPDSSKLDKHTIISLTVLEVRGTNKDALGSAYGTTGFNMQMQLWMNNNDIAGGTVIATSNNMPARNTTF